jgi:charged multivesicular body protein 7
MSRTTSLYASKSLPIRIASFVVGKPLWWALEQAGIVGEEGVFGSSSRAINQGTSWYGDYVLLPLVEAAGDAVIEVQAATSGTPADALYSWSSFSKAFSSAVIEAHADAARGRLQEDDMKVLLKYLERDRGVLVYDDDVS